MEALKLNKFLESFGKLENDEKEYALEIINKQMSDDNRKKIVNRVKESRANLKKGNVKKGSIKDLYKDLEND
ncbi:MAG: hypothetical protein IPL53_00325 [Ignavibacteria bacterium]|nr:hypothetical protein [Ignavibacteria bacterium]